WGGPGQGFDWPVSPGGITVDANGNVWITAAGAPEPLAAPARAGGARRGAAAGGAAAGAAAGAGGGAAGGAAAGAASTGAGGVAGGGQGRGAGGRGGANAAPRPEDAHVLKFSRAGQFLLQIGKAGVVGDKDSQTNLDHPVGIAVDTAANE